MTKINISNIVLKISIYITACVLLYLIYMQYRNYNKIIEGANIVSADSMNQPNQFKTYVTPIISQQ